MTGGGINANNIKKIASVIKPSAIHFSGTSLIKSNDNSLFSTDQLIVEETKIESILTALN
jgi:copper homeostasis protein CutC